MKKTNHKKEEHDEKTCFRCRLYSLYEEFKYTTETEFILFCFAEAVGSMLAHCEPDDIQNFLFAVQTFHNEEAEGMNDETMH